MVGIEKCFEVLDCENMCRAPGNFGQISKADPPRRICVNDLSSSIVSRAQESDRLIQWGYSQVAYPTP